MDCPPGRDYFSISLKTPYFISHLQVEGRETDILHSSLSYYTTVETKSIPLQSTTI